MRCEVEQGPRDPAWNRWDLGVGETVEAQGVVHLGRLFMSIVGSERDQLQPHHLCERSSVGIPTSTSSKAGEAEPAAGESCLPVIACIRRHSEDAKLNAGLDEPLRAGDGDPWNSRGLRSSKPFSPELQPLCREERGTL